MSHCKYSWVQKSDQAVKMVSDTALKMRLNCAYCGTVLLNTLQTVIFVHSFKIGLAVTADITKCMVMSREQTAGLSLTVKGDNSSTERVEEFKYLGTTLTNQNSIQEEIKRRLKLGNACYLSVQNLLSSSLLPKNLKIKIYRTIILPVVLYGCETWSLTLREEHRLRVCESRVLRRIFGPKRDGVTGEWKNYIMRSLILSTPQPILCG